MAHLTTFVSSWPASQTSALSPFSPSSRSPSACRRRPVLTMSASKLDDSQRIVVTGMGVASCFGTDVDVFYDKLLAGESGIVPITGFDCADWATNFAGEIPPGTVDPKGYVAPKNARRMDPFLLYTVVTGKKALEDAGLGMDTDEFAALDKVRSGILVGSGMGGLNTFQAGVEKLNDRGVKGMSPFFIPYSITNMASALLAIDLGFRGPNYSVSTACATGNYAINNAAMHMKRGEADIMLVGGAEAAILPVGLGGFIACRALSNNKEHPTKASRPWDKNRDGFVLGEGAGVLVMETLEHAKKRGAKQIYAEYLGGAQSCDAHHMTEPRQDGSGVNHCITSALENAGVNKERVNYINAHATSTPAGDLAEFRAVRGVFNDKGAASRIKMNATKSMIGHALGAAGGLEAVATIKAIQTGKVHPTINADDTEEEVDLDIVPNVMQELQVDVGISNSFGFGGHNSTVVFAAYEE